MTPEQKQKTRIAVGVVLGFVAGGLITMLLVRNPYDLLATLCVATIAVPLGAILGGFVVGITAKDPPPAG